MPLYGDIWQAIFFDLKKSINRQINGDLEPLKCSESIFIWGKLSLTSRIQSRSRVRSHAPSIQSHRGTKGVWPDFQPMRVPEEPVCIHLDYFGKIQFLPPCIWNLLFMSTASGL